MSVSAGENDLVKRQNELQMMKLKILFLPFPAYTCIALFQISWHCCTYHEAKSVHYFNICNVALTA